MPVKGAIKGKHFTSIIMDDIVGDPVSDKIDPFPGLIKMVEMIEKATKEKEMATKAKTESEIETVRAGNVSARIYPDGRVCLEVESQMEELWLKGEEVGDLIDCIGAIAEKTGARPTEPSKESGVSYQQQQMAAMNQYLTPGQIQTPFFNGSPINQEPSQLQQSRKELQQVLQLQQDMLKMNPYSVGLPSPAKPDPVSHGAHCECEECVATKEAVKDQMAARPDPLGDFMKAGAEWLSRPLFGGKGGGKDE